MWLLELASSPKEHTSRAIKGMWLSQRLLFSVQFPPKMIPLVPQALACFQPGCGQLRLQSLSPSGLHSPVSFRGNFAYRVATPSPASRKASSQSSDWRIASGAQMLPHCFNPRPCTQRVSPRSQNPNPSPLLGCKGLYTVLGGAVRRWGCNSAFCAACWDIGGIFLDAA